MVRPDLMPSFFEFGYRYCDPRQSFSGINFDNASNILELKKILQKRIRLRTRKVEFASKFPEIYRQKMEYNPEMDMIAKIHKIMKSYILPWER